VALTNMFAKAFLQDVARVSLKKRKQKKRETVFSFDRELCDEAQVAYGDRTPDSRNRMIVSLFVLACDRL